MLQSCYISLSAMVTDLYLRIFMSAHLPLVLKVQEFENYAFTEFLICINLQDPM